MNRKDKFDFATVRITETGLAQKERKELPVLEHHVRGKWEKAKEYYNIPDPITGDPLLKHPLNVANEEFDKFIDGFSSCPKSGLHNPLKNPERLLMLGEVCFKAAMALQDNEVADYFARLIQSVMPKSYVQCKGEVTVTRQFLKNFSGDSARFLLKGETTPGDYPGQESCIYNWPFGPVVIVAPFNFPLEIPALQLVGALITGNRPTIKAASTVSVVIEQFLRLLFACGLPEEDVDLIHCGGSEMEQFIIRGSNIIRQLQFTGSSSVAKKLAKIMNGKIAVEDAGFDWKIIGPDYHPEQLRWIAWQSDQDAYAASGQKCSAQSFLCVHDAWWDHLIPILKELASRRKLENLTVGPVLTWKTDAMLEHIDKLVALPGAKLLFGGKKLEGHKIPEYYGAIEPTAVFVPLESIVENFSLVTTEVFGPIQVITRYGSEKHLLDVLDILEKMNEHLTAAVVSSNPEFINKILAYTVNGTTYAGIRARTTGAPQNHWFGPAGDPRAAGIGTPEAILKTWTGYRCVIRDVGPVPKEIPAQS